MLPLHIFAVAAAAVDAAAVAPPRAVSSAGCPRRPFAGSIDSGGAGTAFQTRTCLPRDSAAGPVAVFVGLVASASVAAFAAAVFVVAASAFAAEFVAAAFVVVAASVVDSFAPDWDAWGSSGELPSAAADESSAASEPREHISAPVPLAASAAAAASRDSALRRPSAPSSRSWATPAGGRTFAGLSRSPRRRCCCSCSFAPDRDGRGRPLRLSGPGDEGAEGEGTPWNLGAWFGCSRPDPGLGGAWLTGLQRWGREEGAGSALG